MKPSEVKACTVYTDGSEFRLVTGFEPPLLRRYSYPISMMRTGFRRPGSEQEHNLSLATFAKWARREATPEEIREHFPEGTLPVAAKGAS